MKVRSAIFTIESSFSSKSIDDFIEEVGWENIKSIVPITEGVIFFYEIEDSEKEN